MGNITIISGCDASNLKAFRSSWLKGRARARWGNPSDGWTSFKHWRVTRRNVDLYGVGRTVSHAQSAPYMFPYEESQKLCVDMVGTAHSVTSEVHEGGKLESRKAFRLIAGAPYRLSFKMSGQQRHPGANRGIKVRIQGNALFEQDFGPVAFDFPFTTFSADVTGDGLPHHLGFECLPYFAIVPPDYGGYVEDTWGGNLLDDIKLERLDTAEILLDDDFNTENDG